MRKGLGWYTRGFGWWLMGQPVDVTKPLTHWRWKRYGLGARIYNWGWR